jgi:hypothetical protein
MVRDPMHSGRGFFPEPFNGDDVTVKDTASVKVKAKDECGYCHIASAKDVWTQFYPLLDR